VLPGERAKPNSNRIPDGTGRTIAQITDDDIKTTLYRKSVVILLTGR
jgi:hypothetical protein